MPEQAGWKILLGLLSSTIAMTVWMPSSGDLVSGKPFGKSAKTRSILELTPPLPVFSARVSQNLTLPRPTGTTPSPSFFSLSSCPGRGSPECLWPPFSWLGISSRDDTLERRSSARLLAAVAALTGSVLRFAAGHIGEGPGLEALKRQLPDHRWGRRSRLISRFAYQLLAELR